jgi:hypothetical protein
MAVVSALGDGALGDTDGDPLGETDGEAVTAGVVDASEPLPRGRVRITAPINATSAAPTITRTASWLDEPRRGAGGDVPGIRVGGSRAMARDSLPDASEPHGEWSYSKRCDDAPLRRLGEPIGSWRWQSTPGS